MWSSGRLRGGPGADAISAWERNPISTIADYSDAPGPVVMSLDGRVIDDGHGDADTLVDIVNVRGSAQDDVLVAAVGAFGARIEGGPGNDVITGTAWTDLSGGPGNDHLIDGPFGNVLSGGPGDDRVDGGGGNDSYVGGPGDDSMHAPDTFNSVDGGEGLDRMNYAAASSGLEIRSGVRLDVEIILGTRFNDTFIGDDRNDVFLGRAGDDRIFGGGGDDILWGGPGDDHLVGGPGADRLSGGLGDGDVVDYSGAVGPVRVSLNGAANDGEAGEGDFVEPTIEVVIGSAFDDVLVGSNDADILRGEGGNDTIFARGGDDQIFGGLGTDLLHGGADTDVCTDAGTDTTFTLCESRQP